MDEYFTYYKRYIKEYGDKTCVLMQIGSFYEINMIKNDNEHTGNLDKIAKLLNIQVTKKNKNIERVDASNPFMGGFPKPAITKFLPILLEKGYTVVLVDQVEESGSKMNRKVSAIYSPSIQPIHNDNDIYNDKIYTSVVIEFIDEHTIGYSICNINMTTNKIDVLENYTKADKRKDTKSVIEGVLDDVYTNILKYSSKEVSVYIKGNGNDAGWAIENLDRNYIINYLNLYDSCFHLHSSINREKSCIEYQNAFLKKVYKDVEFGLLDPIVYFDLSLYPLAVINIVLCLEFIGKHDHTYIKGISPPEIVQLDSEFLSLELNTLNQLNILPSKGSRNKCLLDIIDKTSTSLGGRALKASICQPYNNSKDIVKRYKLSEAVDSIDKKFTKELYNILGRISDIEKLHRKLSLGALHPYELVALHESYTCIKEIHDVLSTQKESAISQFIETLDIKLVANCCNDILKTFNMNELSKANLNDSPQLVTNFFVTGSEVSGLEKITKLQNDIQEIQHEIEGIRGQLESLIMPTSQSDTNASKQTWVKLVYSDCDGYHFTCTKIRANLLKKALGSGCEFDLKNGSSSCKIFSQKLTKLSQDLKSYKESYGNVIKDMYLEWLLYFYNRYKNMHKSMHDFIVEIDIVSSNIKCKYAYDYTLPRIESFADEESYFKIKSIRHAIIERLDTKTKYVSNDITLNSDNTGIVLYAINSCGKSSLLRSIGICIVMAQCGLYVPCEEMVYYPFKTILTQVDMNDNLWKGQSSFVNEMIGLKRISKVADKNTLVLSDELTKGTEVVSATAIFTASILELARKKCKFIYTTHLQDVAKLDCVKDCKNISIKHLSVEVIGDDIIFSRKLSPGPSSELYGLEIAKAVGLGEEFINFAFNVRDDLTKRKVDLLSTKRSRYNSKKIVDSCEICNYSPTGKDALPLDVHHIEFQCNANEHNYINGVHKHNKNNLVVLCKNCHIKVHQGQIVVNGYQQTLKGVVLNYNIVY